MAVDSIIANPTNKVRVMVGAASGCWAMASNAVDTARPSPMAGIILPMAMVSPAVMIDTTAIIVMLSMIDSFKLFGFLMRSLGRCSNIDSCQYSKDISLYHAGQHTQGAHNNWEEKGRNR